MHVPNGALQIGGCIAAKETGLYSPCITLIFMKKTSGNTPQITPRAEAVMKTNHIGNE